MSVQGHRSLAGPIYRPIEPQKGTEINLSLDLLLLFLRRHFETCVRGEARRANEREREGGIFSIRRDPSVAPPLRLDLFRALGRYVPVSGTRRQEGGGEGISIKGSGLSETSRTHFNFLSTTFVMVKVTLSCRCAFLSLFFD